MKSAQQWQEELNGETIAESIRRIQFDALLHAANVIEAHIIKGEHRPAAQLCKRVILDELVIPTKGNL